MKGPPRDNPPGKRPRPPSPSREDAAPDSVTTVRPNPSQPAREEVSPATTGGDSPNETIMLPHRPVAPIPSPPIAFAPPAAPAPAPAPTGPPPAIAWPSNATGPHPLPQHYAGMPPPQYTAPATAAPPPAIVPQPAVVQPPAAVPQIASDGPRVPRTADEMEMAPSSGRRGAGPGSFSRIFLGSVEKYRAQTGKIGSASQEAAAVLAQQAGPADHRLRGPTLKLRSPLAIVETLVLTLLLPAVGWLVDRNDPFFLNHRFSWIVAAPLLLGLRHGFAPALASAVVLDGLIAAAWRTQIVPMEKLPGETMIGIAALAMITGQFSDVWKRELVRLDGGFDVLRKQLGEVMRAHFLLELSHDRLEERIGKGTPNLRDALVAVQRAAAVRPGATLLELADSAVEIFAQYTNVEVGSLHRVENDRIEVEPVAKIGRPGPFDPNDEQVQEALQTRKLTFIRGGAGLEAGSARTKLLAVVPFVDAHGTLRGLLTVESIPLLAFDRRNLETLALLGGRFADAVAMRGQQLSAQKGQRKELEIRVRRAIRDLVENDVASTLFVLLVRRGGAASDSIETVLGGTLRALDFPYVEQDAMGNYIIYILLPLTDEAGARAFGARIERIVQREGNMPLARAGGFSFHHVLRTDDTAEEVMRRLESKAKLDEGSVEHTIVV